MHKCPLRTYTGGESGHSISELCRIHVSYGFKGVKDSPWAGCLKGDRNGQYEMLPVGTANQHCAEVVVNLELFALAVTHEALHIHPNGWRPMQDQIHDGWRGLAYAPSTPGDVGTGNR